VFIYDPQEKARSELAQQIEEDEAKIKALQESLQQADLIVQQMVSLSSISCCINMKPMHTCDFSLLYCIVQVYQSMDQPLYAYLSTTPKYLRISV
jgi:hypothetical protein